MKFKVTMKDPDTLDDAITDAVHESIEAMAVITNEEEKESLEIIRKEAVHKICTKWFEYSEYITVEIDTEAMTCVVVPRK
jgi:hypothetical protein